MYEIKISKKANKQIKKLPLKIRERIYLTLERIKIRPYHFVKSLAGCKYFGLRVGDYRLILDIINNQLRIIIVEVGHRRNIYKK